ERDALKQAIAMLTGLIRSRAEASAAPEPAVAEAVGPLGPDIAIGPDSLLEPTIMSKKRVFDVSNQAPTIIAKRPSVPTAKDDRTIISRKHQLGLHED